MCGAQRRGSGWLPGAQRRGLGERREWDDAARRDTLNDSNQHGKTGGPATAAPARGSLDDQIGYGYARHRWRCHSAHGRLAMTAPVIAPRLQTVLVILDVAGRQVGLPIANVQDVVKVRRTGPGPGWRVHRGAAAGAICPPGMLAVSDRCVPLVELGERLGVAPTPFMRRLRSVAVVQSGEHVLGLLVDDVTDIVEAPSSAIRAVAPMVGQHPAIRQIARLDSREIELLDVERLLDTPQLPVTLRLTP